MSRAMGRSYTLAILFIAVLFVPIGISQGQGSSKKKYRRELASLDSSEVEYEGGKVARLLDDYNPPTHIRNKRNPPPEPPPDTPPEPPSDSSPDAAPPTPAAESPAK